MVSTYSEFLNTHVEKTKKKFATIHLASLHQTTTCKVKSREKNTPNKLSWA